MGFLQMTWSWKLGIENRVYHMYFTWQHAYILQVGYIIIRLWMCENELLFQVWNLKLTWGEVVYYFLVHKSYGLRVTGESAELCSCVFGKLRNRLGSWLLSRKERWKFKRKTFVIMQLLLCVIKVCRAMASPSDSMITKSIYYPSMDAIEGKLYDSSSNHNRRISLQRRCVNCQISS